MTITFLQPDDTVEILQPTTTDFQATVVEVTEFHTIVEVLKPERYIFVNAARNAVPKSMRTVGQKGYVWTHGFLAEFRDRRRCNHKGNKNG